MEKSLPNIFTKSLRGPSTSCIWSKLDAYDVYAPACGEVLRYDFDMC